MTDFFFGAQSKGDNVSWSDLGGLNELQSDSAPRPDSRPSHILGVAVQDSYYPSTLQVEPNPMTSSGNPQLHSSQLPSTRSMEPTDSIMLQPIGVDPNPEAKGSEPPSLIEDYQQSGDNK